MMSRAEHLAWCKQRALAYLDGEGNVGDAFASMASDLQKHPATANHRGMEIGLGLMMIGQLSTVHAMREFINGFN